ncbi:MAG: Uma2 family endonuclease, partial [Candidatus Rokubacteria bacterium]|nr:Uma2 family endonuclease [Candidatus Rokubacteria bacterium]
MATQIEGSRTRRWTRREYDRLIGLGVLHADEPIELLDGHLVVKEPQNPSHATAYQLVTVALRRVFGRGWDVRPGLPIALDATSEPEPDVSVVRGDPRDYRRDHPARPVLIVEVALSSLRLNRRLKALRTGRHSGVLDRRRQGARARGVPRAHGPWPCTLLPQRHATRASR